ncbi:MAG: ribosome maturation factor RimM [Actinobacteria bacterium]|nr:ribosome maturation factor RimM [Actinomycetota bacterium]
MTDPSLLEVGRLGRAHGIRGEMFVSLTSDRVERVAEGSSLEAEGMWLTIVASRPSAGRFIVRFAEIESRNDAEQMTGKVLRAHPLDDPEALWVHEMIGAMVVDVEGTEWGRCVAVVANPASDLIELDSGALVPSVFVVESTAGNIVINPPEGLFELGGTADGAS